MGEEKFSGMEYCLQEMNREELQDALRSIRTEILDKVQKMSDMWEAIAELNKKKRMIQLRLQYLGVGIRDQ